MYTILSLPDGQNALANFQPWTTTTQFRDALLDLLLSAKQKARPFQICAVTRGKLMRFSDDLQLQDYADGGQDLQVSVFLQPVEGITMHLMIDGINSTFILHWTTNSSKMLGLPRPFGDSQRVAATTYDITGDTTGVVQVLLRIIAQAYKVSGMQPSFQGAPTPMHTLWQRSIQQATRGRNCDVADLAGFLSPVPLDTHGAVLKAINSLPGAIIDDLFMQRYKCEACQKVFSGIFVLNASNHSICCQVCQNQSVKVVCPAKLQLFRGQHQSCRISVNGQSLALMAALSRKNDRIAALFSDFFAKDDYHFALSCPQAMQNTLSIKDMTFLKPDIAQQWLQGQNRRCQEMAGIPEIYVYYNMQYCANQAVQKNVNDMYGTQQRITVDQPQQSPNLLNTSGTNITPQVDNRVLEQWHPPTQRKFVSELLISTPMIILLVVAGLLLLVNIVLLSILQHMKNDTMVLNNLDYSGQMNLGYTEPQPVLSRGINSKQASIYSIQTDSAYIQRLNASTVSAGGLSSDCNYAEILQLDQLNLNNSIITPKELAAEAVNVTDFTFTQQLQLQSGIDVSGLNIEQLTTGQARGGSYLSMGSLNVNAGATASEKAETINITAVTAQADDIQATGTSTFGNLTTNNLYMADVTAQQNVECNYSIRVGGTAVLVKPQLDNHTTIRFQKDMSLLESNITGTPTELVFQFSNDLVFNATTNINAVQGNADVTINTSDTQNLTCGAAPCNISVPSVTLGTNIVVSGPITVNNLTATDFESGDMTTSQIVVPSASPLLEPLVVLNGTGLITTLPVSLDQAQFTQNSISFNPSGLQVTLPAINSQNTNFTADIIKQGGSLVVETKNLTIELLNSTNVQLSGDLSMNSTTVSSQLNATNIEANSIQGNSLMAHAGPGQTCYGGLPTDTECNFLVGGNLSNQQIWCDSICNVQTP